jgi:serine/threonine-protein kinase
MIGQKLGHYRLEEKIGAGGMGEVYRARDEHLERDVAIKVLPSGALADESARKRFRKEALALSKLNHPNIATVFDFDTQEGVDFLVMEHIAGMALNEKLAAGPLAEKEIARLGMQMAEGLAAAHSENIIHRDLKPGNLRLTSDGRLKILDFGLAKLLRPAPEEAVTAESLSQSQLGAAAGTLPYMAPEQLRGEEVDARTDIYAAGCVLYELATAQRPFSVTQGPKLIDAILHQPPVSPRDLNPRVSPGLETVILKALDKEPDRRYQSARDLRTDLDRLTTGLTVAVATPRPQRAWRVPALAAGAAVLALTALVGLNVGRLRDHLFGAPVPKIESLAVLPLDNLSRDPEQEYFADGMTEALIAELSKVKALKVISRTSAMRYKGTDKSMPQIARELDVDALIEGSVAHEGDQVRITVQLIHGPTDKHLWAESYQRELRGVLALQSQVARAIAREIQVTVTPAEATRLAGARSVNPEAYRHYLLGRHHWSKRTPEGFQKAAEHFQQAIDLDPTYAQAYVGLADVYALQPSWGLAAPSEAFPRARAEALKSLKLDDNLAEPYAALGLIKHDYDRDWKAAEQDFRRALELNPNYATTHHWYGQLLSHSGRHEEAIAEANLAERLDPLAPNISRSVGQTLFYARRYDEAVRHLQRTQKMYPEFLSPSIELSKAYAQLGRYEEALAEAEKARKLPEFDPYYGAIGWVYARAGRKAEARRLLRRLQELSKQRYIDPAAMATIYIGLGQNEEALTWLERAYEQRGSYLILFLNVDPVYDPLRDDPRFQDLLRRMNLPEN